MQIILKDFNFVLKLLQVAGVDILFFMGKLYYL